MELKKKYEKMYYEELLRKYEELENYCDKEKIIILNEVKKRKLVEEEEIEKIVNDLDIELITESTLNENENVEKANIFKLLRRYLFSNEKIKIYEKKGFKNEEEYRKRYAYRSMRGQNEGARIFFSVIVIIGMIYSFLVIPTLFFKPTEGVVIYKSDVEIMYQYTVDGEINNSNKIFMFQEIISDFFTKDIKKVKIKNYKNDEKVIVYYSLFNKEISLLELGMMARLFFFTILFMFFKILADKSLNGIIYLRDIGWMIFLTLEYIISIIRTGGI